MAHPPAPGGRLRWARRAGALVLALAAALVLWTAWALLSVRDDLARGRAQLIAATEDGGDAAATRSLLADAAEELRGAHGRLAAPGPALVARVPLLGRTPRAARVTTDAALAAARAGQAVLAATTEGPPLVDGGRLDPVGLARLGAAFRTSGAALAGPVGELRRLKTGLTPSVLGNGVLAARDRLDELPQTLRFAADAVDALAGLTGRDGPQRLLVVLENNAELRGTGGIVSVFAEATAADGRIRLGRFRDVDEVADAAGTARRVPAPADYHRLWGPYLADTTLWKNTNMSPDIATSSAVLAGVAGTSLGRRPDAIVWLDVRTLAGIIGATSPARLPDGTELTEESTVSVLLSGAYGGVADTRAGQAARRARLRAAADAVVARLLEGRPDASRLSLALTDAARGRHLALWSGDRQRQQALSKAALSGEVAAAGGDIVSAAVQNFGGGDRDGNKLDFYARRQVTVRVRVGRDSADVEQEVTLRNAAPPRGLPVYVAGRATPGTTNNFFTLAVPTSAQLTSFTRGGEAVRTEVLPEGDHRVVTDALSLPPGTATTWRLRYRLPLEDGRYVLRLLPQPVAVDAGVNVQVTAVPGLRLRTATGRAGDVRLSQPFAERLKVDVRADRPGLLKRVTDGVRSFWTEPVRLPF